MLQPQSVWLILWHKPQAFCLRKLSDLTSNANPLVNKILLRFKSTIFDVQQLQGNDENTEAVSETTDGHGVQSFSPPSIATSASSRLPIPPAISHLTSNAVQNLLYIFQLHN